MFPGRQTRAPKTGAGRECTSHGHGREAGGSRPQEDGQGTRSGSVPGAGQVLAQLGGVAGRPQGSGLPGAEHVQQRQRASAGQVLAQLAGVASRPKRSGLPGAEYAQQRQPAGVGQVLAQLADVAGRPQGSGPPGAGHVQQGQRASAGQVLADVASRSQGLGFGLSGAGHILQRQRPGLQGLVPVKNCPQLQEINEVGYRPHSTR